MFYSRNCWKFFPQKKVIKIIIFTKHFDHDRMTFLKKTTPLNNFPSEVWVPTAVLSRPCAAMKKLTNSLVPELWSIMLLVVGFLLHVGAMARSRMSTQISFSLVRCEQEEKSTLSEESSQGVRELAWSCSWCHQAPQHKKSSSWQGRKQANKSAIGINTGSFHWKEMTHAKKSVLPAMPIRGEQTLGHK